MHEFTKGEVNLLFNVTINDISVIYVTVLKKTLDLYGRAPIDKQIS